MGKSRRTAGNLLDNSDLFHELQVVPEERFRDHLAVFRWPTVTMLILNDLPVGGISFPSGPGIGFVKVPVRTPDRS